jgi:aarF domain-containing kinase
VGFLSYNIRSSRSSSSSVGSLRMVATLTPPAVAAQAATSPPVPTVATSTTTSSTTSSTTTRPTEQKLSVAARLSRAASFYSAAVPIFASYKMLDQVTKWRKTVLNEDVTEAEVEAQFQQLHDWGSDKIADKIKELKGFYVKTGQIISTRVDIFPEQYTSKLASTQDALDPLPAEVVKEVVRTELLGGADLSELFAEFDDVPLGSASIAQVHRAKLLDGRVVAVKVQRPGIAPKLLGDIANLKNFAKIVGDALPIDYYKVCVCGLCVPLCVDELQCH